MSLSILDLYVLCSLERGLKSPYELQRSAGISLGASLPALRRLLDAGLVSKEEGTARTNRPRHSYSLTRKGLHEAQTGWKLYLEQEEIPGELDAVLRISDIASRYGTDKRKIRSFLKRAAQRRRTQAGQAEVAVFGWVNSKVNILSYSMLRLRCDAARLMAEGKALEDIAALLQEPKPAIRSGSTSS